LGHKEFFLTHPAAGSKQFLADAAHVASGARKIVERRDSINSA
jgi:hypothetical protein